MEWKGSKVKSRRGSGKGCRNGRGAPYQELGQAVRPEENSLRSGLSTRGPKLGSSCSPTLGKSLGLSFPVCKMESTWQGCW